MEEKITKKIFYPNRCSFLLEPNNLVSVQMINTILDTFENDAINKLNEYLKSIKFLVGGKQWHSSGQKGYLKFATSEIDFNKNSLLFYISNIFELGYKQWRNLSYGALRRFLWESFFHEMIQQLCSIVRLDLSLANEAKKYDLNKSDEFTLDFIKNLFKYERQSSPRINFILMSNKLWNDPIPANLGLLDILYRRRINQLKKQLYAKFQSNYQRIKLFNELRKNKLKYIYEYNFSELINYCIHSEHFQRLFVYHSDSCKKLQKSFYSKAKRIILTYFKENNIIDKLYPHKDSAGRRYYFLTHTTFEEIKGACLQTCITKIKNNVLELYETFRNFYFVCPICKRIDCNHEICEKIYFSSKYNYFKKLLLEKMNESRTLQDLNNKNFYFGIPCERCFQFTKNIQGKYSDLNELQKFIVKFSTCPICGVRNDNDYLISLYYNKKEKFIKDYLIENNIYTEPLKKYNINIGIPCCSCFEKIFGEAYYLENLNLSNQI